MKKFLFIFLCFLFSFSAQAAERIISLKPNITEIIYALHAEEKLVGVTTYCNRPAAAEKLPKVADYLAPSIEKTIALQPDLLLTSQENGKAAPILRLQDLGYHIEFFNFDTVASTLNAIVTLSKTLQHEDAGIKLTEQLRNDFAQLQKNAPPHKPRVLFVISAQPLIAAGSNTLMSEFVELAGGVNVLQKQKTRWPRLNEENLLELKPDIIFTLYMAKENTFEPWEKFPQLPAMQKKAIYHLETDDFRAGPNMAKATQQLQKLIYETAQ